MGSLLCSDMRDGERREVGRDSLRGPGATRRADRLNALGRCMRSEGSSVGRRSPVCPRLHAESLDAVPAIDAALGEEHSGAEKRLPSRLIRQCSLCAGGPLYLGTAQHQVWCFCCSVLSFRSLCSSELLMTGRKVVPAISNEPCGGAVQTGAHEAKYDCLSGRVSLNNHFISVWGLE